MSKKKETENKIPPACEYCVNCVRVANTDAFLCDFKGVVKADGCCRKYKFDLLKIEPERAKPLPLPEDLDFSV